MMLVWSPVPGSGSKYDRYSPILILWLAGINLIDPADDPARQVLHLLEPLGSQEVGGLRAPRADLALHHVLVARIELDVAPGDVAERNQDRSGDLVDLILVRLAHVDDCQPVAPIEPLFQIGGRD